MTQDDEAPLPLEPEEELPLAPIDDDGTPAPAAPASIKTFGTSGAAHAGSEVKHRRALNLNGTGATRCKIFHSKLTVAALHHMVNQINEWVDAGDLEIKHISEVVGVMEGKTMEPNLIVTVWY